jgi:demethoxyubiquinone hydroxylase (CLK1/Coq7/Cat5 family)
MRKTVLRNFCSNWSPNMPKYKVVLLKDSHRAPHPVWEMKEAEKVKITHVEPMKARDKVAFFMMKGLRKTFDYFTRYKPGQMNEAMYMKRCIFLETVAGVPGMIGGMMRHFESLRFLREDGGWIHHLLEEAENERMHLLTFLKLKQPHFLERLMIMSGQLVFILYYSLMYLLSHKMAHRFVGYLEEEAVKTYTGLIKELDEGRLPEWSNAPAPPEAIKYWALSPNAKLRDVFVAIRADEVAHREFNHHFADMEKTDPMIRHKLYIHDGKNPINWEEDHKEIKEVKDHSNQSNALPNQNKNI